MKHLAKTDLAKAIVFDKLFRCIVDRQGNEFGSPEQFDKIEYSAGLFSQRGICTITIKCLKVGKAFYEFYAKFDAVNNKVFFNSCLVTRPFKSGLMVSMFNNKYDSLWDLEGEEGAEGAEAVTDSVVAESECESSLKKYGYEL